MGQTLVSTLMDTTFRLEGLVNNIQHSNFFQRSFLATSGKKELRRSDEFLNR